MPKTWDQTLDGHREAVRRTVIESALALASEMGFQKVSMSEVAARAGITRATLYKYFPDVDSIFMEWHSRTLDHHLVHVEGIAEGEGGPAEQLLAILSFFATNAFRHHGSRFAQALHRREHAAAAEDRLIEVVERVVARGAGSGVFRTDVSARELAVFLHGSLSAVHRLPDEAAVHRLVAMLVKFVGRSGHT